MNNTNEYQHSQDANTTPTEYVKITYDNYSPLTWVITIAFIACIGIGAGLVIYFWASNLLY